MDHALTFALATGIFGLIFLSALMLRQGSRVLASLEAIRVERMARSPIGAPTAGLPAPMRRASPISHSSHPMDAGAEDIFVPVPAFDAEGNPYPKRMKLDVLLRGVGIGRADWDPTLAVVEQAQTELRALAELAAHVGPDNSEVLDLSDLGNTLADISQRLEIAHELLDRPQLARSSGEDGGKAEEPPVGTEPPSSADDSGGGEQG